MELALIGGLVLVIATVYLVIGVIAKDDRARAFTLTLALWFFVLATTVMVIHEIRELGDRIDSLGEVSGE